MPNMQVLRETDHAKWLHLLELFAYGTFEDYLRIQVEGPRLPDLLPVWEHKLRMLSVLSLVRKLLVTCVCECFIDEAAELRAFVSQVKESNEVHYSRLKVRTIEALLSRKMTQQGL